MNRLPPMKIAQGEPFAYAVTVDGQSWTGYTGTAKFKTTPKAQWRRTADPLGYEQEPFLSVTATGDALGEIDFALTAAQTADFPALAVLGYRRQAVCEISMTNGTDVQKFQATVSVSAQI